MSKTLVGYCFNCGKDTKHKVIQCEESLGWRIYENILTFGLIAAMGYDYKCECTRCGEINTIST